MTAADPSAPPAPQVYDWEPSNAAIAAQYGIDPATVLRFDLNTPPTVNPIALSVLDGPFETSLSEYPDADYKGIADAAAAYTGVDATEVLVGAGADEVLDTIAKAFLPTGGRSIIPIPTYAMYAVHTSQRGAVADTVLRLPPDQGFRMDLEQVLARLPGASVVWLCSPVNPTGLPERREDLVTLLDAAAALGPDGPMVVVDEAYFEFAPETLIPLRSTYPGLIVVRTVSKAFALAGFRVGYAVAQRPTIARLEAYRPPNSIGAVSAAVAAAALRRPEATLERVRATIAERERFAAQLRAIGIEPLPSVTNFLLLRIGTYQQAESLTEALQRGGVVPRFFGPSHPLAGHVRVTVRGVEQDDRLVALARAWKESAA
ncbi:MAG: histidinol-phosphate transaminase [Chloroflexota bacterium]